MNRFNLIRIATLSAALGVFSTHLHAQVYVDGLLLEDQQLSRLEAITGGSIPAGSYWLDESGNWGFMGNWEVQGNIYTDNATNQQRAQKRYSSYYSSGGAANGSYASDGECSIISIEGMSVSRGNC